MKRYKELWQMYIIFFLMFVFPVSVSATTTDEREKITSLVSVDASGAVLSVEQSHDEFLGNGYRWIISDWAVTISEINDCNIPNDVIRKVNGVIGGKDNVSVASKKGEVNGKTQWEIDKYALYTFAMTQGVVPDLETGKVTVYLQPIFEVQRKKGDTWETEANNLTDVKGVTALHRWADAKLLKTAYNVKIESSIESKYSIQYKRLVLPVDVKENTSLTEYDSSSVILDGYGVSDKTANVGSAVKYNTLDINGTITYKQGEENVYNMTLVGIKVETENFGSSGEALINCLDASSQNDLYYFTEDSVRELVAGYGLQDAYGDEIFKVKNGYLCAKSRSGIYDALENATLRFGWNTVITVYYIPVCSESMFYGRCVFETGTKSIVRLTGDSYNTGVGGVVTLTGDMLGVGSTAMYAGSNKWQLYSTRLHEAGSNLSGKLGVGIKNEVWDKSYYNYNIWGTLDEWRREAQIGYDGSALKNKLGIKTEADNSVKYVYQGNYRIYAPQVELKYYKDANGKLTLFGVTSNGDGNYYSPETGYSADFSYDNLKKNFYGAGGGGGIAFERNLNNQIVGGASYDLSLTQCYVYEGPMENAIAGYLDDTSNCWGIDSLPVNGKLVSAKFDGEIDAGSSVWYASADALLGGAESDYLKVSIDSVPMNPLIYVTIYEAHPTVYCMSYFANSSELTSDTQFVYTGVGKGTVDYDKTYSIGKRVALSVGINSVASSSLYAQDGIDDGITDISSTDLKSYWTTSVGKRLYCTRYAWVTGDADKVNSIVGMAGTVSWQELCDLVGSFEASTLTGDLVIEGGTGVLVKLFFPYNWDENKGVWHVNYLYMNNVFKRIDRAQLVTVSHPVINNAMAGGSYLERLTAARAGVACVLVNVGVSTKNVGGKGYSGDEIVGDSGASSYSYNSAAADQDYAKETMPNLLNKTGIDWYSADHDNGTLKLKDAIEWFHTDWNNLPDGTNAWHWYLYMPKLSYSIASVLEDNIDGEAVITTVNAYEKVELNPYTETTTIGLEPFKENPLTGQIYYLTRYYYGYATDDSGVITQTVLDRLADTSVSGFSGGQGETTLYSANKEGSYTSYGVNGGTIEDVSVYLEQLHVVGVYKVYEPNAKPSQGEVKLSTEYKTYRDTEGFITTPHSWNDLKYNESSLFKGFLVNDSVNSSDEFEASLAIPAMEYLQTYAEVPKYLADVSFVKTTTKREYQTVFYKSFNSCLEETDAFGNVYRIYNGECYEVPVTVHRENYNWSLDGGVVWVPDDATIKNDIFSDERHHKVVMKAAGYDDIKATIGFRVGDPAEFYYPDFGNENEPSDLSICEGVTDCGLESYSVRGMTWVQNDFDDRAESLVEPITTSNQQVEFCDGEGTITVLLEHTEAMQTVDEPNDVPFAEMTSISVNDGTGGAFNSKNGNAIKIATTEGEYSQEDTSKLQIATSTPNGITVDNGSAVHYITVNDNQRFVCQRGIEYTGVLQDAVANGIGIGIVASRVTVLTPVVANFVLSEETVWDQSVLSRAGTTLVLDKTFTLTTSAWGSHCGLPGYGTKDYQKYVGKVNAGSRTIDNVAVKFPFVTILVEEDEQGKLSYKIRKANTWYPVGFGQSTFLLPSWVDEKDYSSISVRVVACNATNDVGTCVNAETEYIEYGSNDNWLARSGNGWKWTYVAQRNELASVVGRVYGFTITDIGDYPLWEDYFKSGGQYYSGVANRDGVWTGRLLNRTFPLVSGDHPTIANEGYVKAGYSVRFKLETVGTMFNRNDVISIVPEFYWVSEEGGSRKKVDVYYDRSEDETLIKVGSSRDRLGVNYLSFSSGKFGVDTDKIIETAEIIGEDSSVFMGHQAPTWTLGDVQLGQYTRLFVGDEHATTVTGTSTVNLFASLKQSSHKNLFDEVGITEDDVRKSVQEWYGMYYLPDPFYVTMCDEDTVMKYCKDGVSYNEFYTDADGKERSIWLEDGYLIVHFTVKTVNNGQESLAYNAAEIDGIDHGMCDMWSAEIVPTKKTSAEGVEFVLDSGDFIIYDMKDIGYDDVLNNYGGGGTH